MGTIMVMDRPSTTPMDWHSALAAVAVSIAAELKVVAEDMAGLVTLEVEAVATPAAEGMAAVVATKRYLNA
jgi:hypothetical protein